MGLRIITERHFTFITVGSDEDLSSHLTKSTPTIQPIVHVVHGADMMTPKEFDSFITVEKPFWEAPTIHLV